MQNLTCSSALILRSPLYSFCNYSPEKLKDFLTDPYFIMGVYLASPELYTVLENANYNIQNLNKSQYLSLAKYFNRIHYRPTPFGSFSALSVTHWNQKHHNITLGGLDHLIFHSDWDQEVILKISAVHTNEKWKEERLYINRTLYEVKEEYRYVRTHFNFDDSNVKFSLEALHADPLIKEVLSLVSPLKTGQQLLDKLCVHLNFRPDEANDYIHFLLQAQLLLTGSHPNVLGKKVIRTDALKIPALNFPDLEKAKEAKNTLDNIFAGKNLTNGPHPFYINTSRPALGGLNMALQQNILSSLNVLSKIQGPSMPPALKAFKEAFNARYDLEEIPLLKALDPEIGIDYANLAVKNMTNGLLNDINFPQAEPTSDHLNWLDMHKLLLRKWNTNTVGIPEINLSLDEPEILRQNESTINLPPSIAVMFRVLGDQILIESAGGVTACALIARFASTNYEIKDIAHEIISAEQMTNPNVVFAEINQLSAMHVDNVNKRPHLYDYEIPINTVSCLPAEKQIHLNDLLLSIRHDRLIIRSKKLGKEVIPRLTSAYNYTNCDLALFRFLCDIQHQGLQSNLGFNIESFFPGLSSYPRVKLGNVIISPAKWFLNEDEIEQISKSAEVLNNFCQEMHWSQHIALTQNDQQLIFNLSNKADICLFQTCIQKAKKVQLQEFFLPDNQTVKDHANLPVINQFIALLTNTKPAYNAPLPYINNKPLSIERDFSLGSEWLYIKIYGHEQSANNLLSNELLNLLNKAGLTVVKKWFFVRYTDPKPHIRLRILANKKHVGLIIEKLEYCLNDHIKCNTIQDYQAGIYRREIERYGEELIDEVESLFHYSSKLVCQYIKQLNKAPNTLNYYGLALISTYNMIYLFNDFILDEVDFTSTVAKSLYLEFSKDKNLQISLDQKYRLMKTEIDQLLTTEDFYQQLKLRKEHSDFINACTTLKTKALNITSTQKLALVADIIHMHLNRIFFEQQRKQELCIYHMLQKYFTTQKAMARKKELLCAI